MPGEEAVRVISALTSEVTCPPMYAAGGLMWTVNERQRLMNAYECGVSREALMRLFPDRTWDAITSQASILRVPRPFKRWTPLEDRLLVELMSQGLSYREAAEYFKGRSPQALNMRACVLRKAGVECRRFRRRWTPEEDQLLVELRKRGLSYAKAAERFNDRSPSTLWSRVNYLQKVGRLVPGDE